MAGTAAAPTPNQSAGMSVTAHVRFWLVAVAGLALDLYSKHWAFHTLGQRDQMVIIPNVLEFQTTFNFGALFGIGQGQTALFVLASILALALVVWIFVRSGARRWLLHVALGATLAGALGNMYDRVNVRIYDTAYRNGLGALELVEDTPQRLVAQLYPAEANHEPYEIIVHRENGGETVVQRVYDPNLPGGYREQVIDGTAETVLGPRVGAVRDFIKIPYRFRNIHEIWPWIFNVADMLLVGGVITLAFYLWRDRGPAEEPATAAAKPAAPDAGSATPKTKPAGPETRTANRQD